MNFNILRTKKALKIKYKTFFIIFKGPLLKQNKPNFQEDESPTLTHFMSLIFLIPPENIRKTLMCSDVFRGYQKRSMARNGLRIRHIFKDQFEAWFSFNYFGWLYFYYQFFVMDKSHSCGIDHSFLTHSIKSYSLIGSNLIGETQKQPPEVLCKKRYF